MRLRLRLVTLTALAGLCACNSSRRASTTTQPGVPELSITPPIFIMPVGRSFVFACRTLGSAAQHEVTWSGHDGLAHLRRIDGTRTQLVVLGRPTSFNLVATSNVDPLLTARSVVSIVPATFQPIYPPPFFGAPDQDIGGGDLSFANGSFFVAYFNTSRDDYFVKRYQAIGNDLLEQGQRVWLATDNRRPERVAADSTGRAYVQFQGVQGIFRLQADLSDDPTWTPLVLPTAGPMAVDRQDRLVVLSTAGATRAVEVIGSDGTRAGGLPVLAGFVPLDLTVGADDRVYLLGNRTALAMSLATGAIDDVFRPAPDAFQDATGIAVDGEGIVSVTDAQSNRVRRLNALGFEFGVVDLAATDLTFPRSVAAGGAESLLVYDPKYGDPRTAARLVLVRIGNM